MSHAYLLCLFIVLVQAKGLDDYNFHPNHIPYFAYTLSQLKNQCLKNTLCDIKELNQGKCWGYEDGCQKVNSFSEAHCPIHHKWVPSRKEQLDLFYRQADFGFIQEQIREMSIMCEPHFKEDSSLECSNYLRFCRGRNIMLNFTRLLTRSSPVRYDMDVLSQGDVAGHCRLHKDRLEKQLQHISPLQSWAPELRNFETLKKPVSEYCHMTIEKPTFIMKIDATVNMYHHFCDFFNLYLSQHVNMSHDDPFSKDIQIIVWESYPYISNFADTFEVFSEHPIWNLENVKGKVICFKNIVFPLLPRMIFGLFYNTPVVAGCEKSGLFKAFSEHVLHRLQIPFRKDINGKIRITLLSRNTSYRNILNEDELINELKKNETLVVQRVVYNRQIPFRKQLELTRNSDILIGMHGAGLTHLLFLPDWGVVFELYNCEDENCYKDLARLRGVKYITWRNKESLEQQDQGNHPDGGAHAKFTNYKFDVKEFLSLVNEAVSHVTQNKPFFTIPSYINHDEF